MKKIPYGESHYPTLIQQGYVYVDKTPYIQPQSSPPVPLLQGEGPGVRIA
ncbi:hypothetical protein U27_00912 [Candidatus Vecturithrix granuli]|uniref:AAA-ATPase-like domain-containing protein n=1 Tax=Vecturithrix granuli TaxID=1499967 RepID=A0A081C8V9_VECG1|nr:hypothetical protein U27_00912 [Candidatus Vecturithrix granuli]